MNCTRIQCTSANLHVYIAPLPALHELNAAPPQSPAYTELLLWIRHRVLCLYNIPHSLPQEAGVACMRTKPLQVHGPHVHWLMARHNPLGHGLPQTTRGGDAEGIESRYYKVIGELHAGVERGILLGIVQT